MAARSPFQGTFNGNARPTVTFAPDALVYINGETEVIGCGACRRKFDLNKFVTSITVDLNIDSPPGSASITLNVPRHAIDDVYFEGVPVITPMMEVEIFAKGFFLVNGVPQYYPIFWGMVTEVTDQYSSGTHTISINCADILKWWDLSKININAAYTHASTAAFGWSVYGNVFAGKNPFDIIWLLAQQSVGDVVLGTGSLSAYNGEKGESNTFKTALEDMALYWQERFSRVRSNLLLFGTEGVAVRGQTLLEKVYVAKSESNWTVASKLVQSANGGRLGGSMLFDATSSSTVAVKKNLVDPGQVNLWQSEYETKLEIANKAKDALGYEFYMDVTGDIVFKPPFFNLDIIDNKPISWIQDIDIIDWDFSESEAEVVTQIQMAGSLYGGIELGIAQDIESFTSVTDWHLLRKYGWRPQTVNSEFMGNSKLLFYYGMDTMDRLNSRRHRGTISIPLRPELRLGFPIYIAPKDQIWYVTGISHSISFGGTAQTTLTLTSRRTKFFAPRGIGKLNLTNFDMGRVSKKFKTGKKDKKGKDEYEEASQAEVDARLEEQKLNIFKYTVRELSQGATFKIETSGEMASIPTTNYNVFKDSPDKNPYAPLILRHPKTGRTCGFPNVVLTYTRPFTFPEAKEQASGQASAKVNASRAPGTDTTKNLVAADTGSLADNPEAQLRIKYMQNRYLYGLNSAGVFVYLYDVGEGGKPVIPETLLIPKSQVTWPDGEKRAQEKESNVIRPVSDERGFEVIGHFRYGRGLKLKDGTLVPRDGQAPDARASVDYQVTPFGSTADGLQVSASGVTLPSGSGNPADTLSSMQPYENETAAGVINANKDGVKPELIFDTRGDSNRFVSTFPLGASEAQKVPLSVEASQLSKALTLAEMTTKMAGGQEEGCGCMLARTDLAFMYVQDTPGPVQSDSILNQAQLGIEVMPISKPDQVATHVNDFLWKLYQSLDTPHQDREKAIRGERSTKAENPWHEAGVAGPPPAPPGATPTAATPPRPPPPPNTTFAPPFGVPEWFNLSGLSWDQVWSQLEGNWEAIGQLWQQASVDMTRATTEQFIQGRIDALQAELAALQAALAQLDANDGNVGVLGETDREDLLRAIARVEQELANAQLELQNARSAGTTPSTGTATPTGD